MTTKKELVDKWTAELKKVEAELQTLEKDHQDYQEEDKVWYSIQDEISKLEKTRKDLINKQYEGNFGSYEIWYGYQSKLPERFHPIEEKFGHRVVRDALNELKDRKRKEIENSQEYKDLDEKISATYQIQYHCLSPGHKRLHTMIGDSFGGLTERKAQLRHLLNEVENIGWFISYCKRNKTYQKSRDERDELRKEIEACIEEIRKVTK